MLVYNFWDDYINDINNVKETDIIKKEKYKNLFNIFLVISIILGILNVVQFFIK